MKQFLFIITLSLLFISCDNSFESTTPFGYDKNKIDGSCLVHSDCEENLLCNLELKKCYDPCTYVACSKHGECVVRNEKVVCDCEETDNIKYFRADDNPLSCRSACNGVDCGNGVCTSLEKNIANCICDDGYQDNDKNLKCEPSCDSINNCGNHGECKDVTGSVVCYCDDGYFDNGSNKCIDPCIDNSCSSHSHCIGESSTEYRCECDSTYKVSVADPNICVVTCATENICKEGFNQVACSQDNEDKITCSCSEGYFTDNNNNCTNPCINYQCSDIHAVCSSRDYDESSCDSCEAGYIMSENGICVDPCSGVTCGGYGECFVQNEKAKCDCDPGYQDNDNDLTCTSACNNPNETYIENCIEDNFSYCDDHLGEKRCVCREGFGHSYEDGDIVGYGDCSISYFILKVRGAVTIPINTEISTEYSYNYDIDCNFNGEFNPTATNQDDSYRCTNVGVHRIAIRGDFLAIQFNNSGDKDKIFSIEQWGSGVWMSMEHAFDGCTNLEGNATDTPNLSRVTNMSYMFKGTKFNQPISNWIVNSVTDMSHLFEGSLFNQYIDTNNCSDEDDSTTCWDVSNVGDMSYMFKDTYFNEDISSWNTSSVTNMSHMFANSAFNREIKDWNVVRVTNMSYMFVNTPFNQEIKDWNVGIVNNMEGMFKQAGSFNQEITNWNISNVTNMSYMFNEASSFNKSLTLWNTSSVTNMSHMFHGARSISCAIDTNGCKDQDDLTTCWDVSNVTDMSHMFQDSFFNQNISRWNTSSVINMSYMFENAKNFNQNINTNDCGDNDSTTTCWNTSSITDMSFMFKRAFKFNFALNHWNTSRVTNMNSMFMNAISFIQNLTHWRVNRVTSCSYFENNASWPENMEPNFINCDPL